MNVILIGMPGSGKSTCGVLAAKMACKSFVDTDLIIQRNELLRLQDIINRKGIDYFSKCEEKALMSIVVDNAVIATGGSAVYSDVGMAYLKQLGTVVYLHLDYNSMIKRIRNFKARGIVLKKGYTLMDMYNERAQLYKKYADHIIDCNNLSMEETAHQISMFFDEK